MNLRRFRLVACVALLCALATSCILGPKQDDPASSSGPPGAGCCGDELGGDTGTKTPATDAATGGDSAGGGADTSGEKTDVGGDAAPFSDAPSSSDTTGVADTGVADTGVTEGGGDAAETGTDAADPDAPESDAGAVDADADAATDAEGDALSIDGLPPG